MNLKKTLLLLSSVTLALGLSAATPKYAWRGMHLDEARHFFGKETVKKFLDRMAQDGFNVFHWHLTDDQGWRVQIDKYPNLTVRGAQRELVADWRPHPCWFDERTSGTYGPYFYTKADIREIVAYAKERGIRVVPEFDIPGHSLAALASYPHLCCFPEMVKDQRTFMHPGFSTPGKNMRTYCLGSDEAVKFLEGVFDEVCALFPDEVIHLGGDEAPQGNWKLCPKCQARMKALGLKNESELQGWFVNHFIDYVCAKGKRAMGWKEITIGKADPKKVIAQVWHEPEGAVELARAGYDIVMSPSHYCYLDNSPGIPGDTMKYFLKRIVSLEKVKSFDPIALSRVPPELQHHILGGECCNWTECTPNADQLFRKAWPRATAFAERLK